MKNTITLLLLSFSTIILAQDFGNFPKIKKEKLLNDLELLHQGLDKFHSGMYWYTPKNTVELAFAQAKKKIDRDMNAFEFHKLVAPLVDLSRENHTNVYLPSDSQQKRIADIKHFPLLIVFLGEKLYCVRNGSDFRDFQIQGKEIESINGEIPTEIVNKLGTLLMSDGYVKSVKYNDLEGFSFSKYHFYYYGQLDAFEVKFVDTEDPIIIKSLKLEQIRNNLKQHPEEKKIYKEHDLLEYKILNSTTAYLGVHDFSNSTLKEESKEKKLKTFLENSFRSIKENKIKNLIVDVSQNTGGSEGNEGLLYSYFGENYQKYLKVRTKTQVATLDNGIDPPIILKAFGFFQRWFVNKKMKDGSLERRNWIGHGLMAYKKAPKHRFSGKVYVIIGPLTYSGGSEFSNMMRTRDLATFVGQETGGGYLGNTSGYTKDLVLPHSKIEIGIPALQFIMNVKPQTPFGRGVLPDHEVIPTFDQYMNDESASLEFILGMSK